MLEMYLLEQVWRKKSILYCEVTPLCFDVLFRNVEGLYTQLNHLPRSNVRWKWEMEHSYVRLFGRLVQLHRVCQVIDLHITPQEIYNKSNWFA